MNVSPEQLKEIAAKIETLRGQYDEELVWGARWDAPGLPLGHIFPKSRIWMDDEPTERELQGTSVIRDESLQFVNRYAYFPSQLYIVCGYSVGYGTDAGEEILQDCEIMALTDNVLN